MEEHIRVELRDLLKTKEDERRFAKKQRYEAANRYCFVKECRSKTSPDSVYCKLHESLGDKRSE